MNTAYTIAITAALVGYVFRFLAKGYARTALETKEENSYMGIMLPGTQDKVENLVAIATAFGLAATAMFLTAIVSFIVGLW